MVQQLILGFLCRQSAIGGFIGTLLHRVQTELTADLTGRRREAALLFLPLREGYSDGPAALVDHAFDFFQRYRKGFA